MKPITKYLICAAVAVSIAVIAVVIFIGSSAAVTAFDKTQKNSYGYSMTVDYAFGDSRNAYVVFSSPAVPPADFEGALIESDAFAHNNRPYTCYLGKDSRNDSYVYIECISSADDGVNNSRITFSAKAKYPDPDIDHALMSWKFKLKLNYSYNPLIINPKSETGQIDRIVVYPNAIVLTPTSTECKESINDIRLITKSGETILPYADNINVEDFEYDCNEIFCLFDEGIDMSGIAFISVNDEKIIFQEKKMFA